MGKFYAIITVIGLGIASLFGYYWYDTESSIQTIRVHEEMNGSSDKENVTSELSAFSSSSSGEIRIGEENTGIRFFGINERHIMSQKQQKK